MGFMDWLFGKKEKRIQERKPTTIQVGDVISYDDTDYIVKGKVVFADGGAQWYSYKLEDNGEFKWLAVDDEGMIWMGLFEDVKIRVEEPVPDEIEFDGTTFELDEKGSARASIVGETGRQSGYKVKYWDFCDDDDRMLSLEKWGDGSIEGSVGIEITMDDITIYPAGESQDDAQGERPRAGGPGRPVGGRPRRRGGF